MAHISTVPHQEFKGTCETSSPANIQERFQVETQELLIKRTRVIACLGFSLIPPFILLDILTTPRFFKLFLTLRLTTSTIMFLIFCLSYSTFFKKFSKQMGVIVALSVSLMIATMIRFVGGYESSYYAGLNTVILAMGLLPWKIKDMLITGILIYVFYLIPILISDKITDWAIFLNNNFFLVTTLLISLVSSRLGYQQRWREFIAKINLETAYLKLQELDRLKTQFFGNISHELRTPLTLILAPVEMMLKDKEGHLEPHQTKNLNVVRNNALRLLKLMNQLLDLIKIDAGKLELRLSQVKVRDFLREIEDSMSSLAEQKNLKLSFECEESLQSEFDRDQIEKVVMNLIYNAVKFTPEGGSIEVRAKTVKRENTETNS